MVIVEPAVPTVLIPPPAIVMDPPPSDNVVVFAATESVCNSLVTLPSTSVAVMVKSPDVPVNVTMPAAVNVTSVPVDEFNVTGDDAPVNVKSVAPPPPTAFTCTHADPV